MEYPLTNEEIQELNEFIKLPREEQSSKLKEFFKKLNPEKVEFLKQFQTQQCIFCGIALGKVNSYKIYEDDDVVCVLDINPASKGHVLIIPKMHLKYSYELSLRIFDIANLIVKQIKEVLGHDSTILVSNGEVAGQKFEHLVINIIPRYKDDGLNFNWELKGTSEKELNELTRKLKFEIKKEPEKIKIEERKPHKIIRIP